MSQATCPLVCKNPAWTTHKALAMSATVLSFVYVYSSSRFVFVLHALLAQCCFRKIGLDAFGIAD